MKTKIMLAICAITVFFNMKAVAQDYDCYNNLTPLQWTCTDWVPTSNNNITIGTYGSCIFQIEYEVRTCTYTQGNCPERIIRQIKINSFGWDWDLCPEISRNIFPGYPDDLGTINENNFRDLFTELQRELAREYFVNDYNAMTPSQKINHQCSLNSFGECQIPAGLTCDNYQVVYSEPKCVKTCWSRKNKNYIWFSLYRCAQEFDACCEQKYTFCYCLSTGAVLVREEATSQPGACVPNPNQETCGFTAPLGVYECLLMCPN